MSALTRGFSIGLTVALLGVAGAVGGGTPLSPAQIADATRQAAENSEAAAANTDRAARDTRALATIMENVQSQVDTSRLLVRTQLELQESSQRGAERSAELARGIEQVRKALTSLRVRLAGLVTISNGASATARESSDSASRLAGSLRRLRARFDEVVKQSRRLNRKARGYSKLREGPG